MAQRDIYPVELLQLARDLLPKRGRPPIVKQRRAVSTAYYALFHRITRDAAFELLGEFESPDAHHVVRWIGHSALRELAKAVVNPVPKFGALLAHPSADLTLLCRAFERLQDARGEADYKHDYAITLPTARALVGQAEAGLEAAVRLRRGRDPSYQRFLRLALGAGEIAKKR